MVIPTLACARHNQLLGEVVVGAVFCLLAPRLLRGLMYVPSWAEPFPLESPEPGLGARTVFTPLDSTYDKCDCIARCSVCPIWHTLDGVRDERSCIVRIKRPLIFPVYNLAHETTNRRGAGQQRRELR